MIIFLKLEKILLIKKDNLNKNNNNIFNYKKEIEKNNLNNNRNNNIFEYDKKIERDNLNNRKNDIEEDFLKKEELCEPYQYQTLLKKNSNLKDYSLTLMMFYLKLKYKIIKVFFLYE